MNGSADVVKGRIKEAAGALTGNEKLRVKGRKDQAVGHVKQAAEKGVERAKDNARKVVDKAKDVAKKTVAKAKGEA